MRDIFSDLMIHRITSIWNIPYIEKRKNGLDIIYYGRVARQIQNPEYKFGMPVIPTKIDILMNEISDIRFQIYNAIWERIRSEFEQYF